MKPRGFNKGMTRHMAAKAAAPERMTPSSLAWKRASINWRSSGHTASAGAISRNSIARRTSSLRINAISRMHRGHAPSYQTVILAMTSHNISGIWPSCWALRGSAAQKRALFPAPFGFCDQQNLFRFFVILRRSFVQNSENFLQRRFFIGLFHGGKLARQTARCGFKNLPLGIALFWLIVGTE